ncbi:MAG: DNA polymerase III subunit delta [Flavisolibacter sp.]
MKVDKIIADLKKKNYNPIYWLEGDEEYFIDQVIDFAEKSVLEPKDSSFNLSIFYGRDTSWAEIMNTARRYPMYSSNQVVIIKEAQAMKDIEKLEAYIEKPLASTLLFIAYKNKKVDGRTKWAKLLKEKAIFLTTKKLYDSELPEWVANLANQRGYSLNTKALALLIDHIGNDLNRLNNEINKLILNLIDRKTITEDDIESFVGISKEFNVFELQHAIASKNLFKAIRIIQYFSSNPKAAPIQLILPSLYNFFGKVLAIYSLPTRDEKSITAALGVPNHFVKDYIQTALLFTQKEIERVILLLHAYNLRAIGIQDGGTEDSFLLQEMVAKMIG